MPFKYRKHLDDLRLDPIHDPEVALDYLADARPRKFRHCPAHLREPRQPIAALNDSMDESFPCGGVCMHDEILNLDEACERLL